MNVPDIAHPKPCWSVPDVIGRHRHIKENVMAQNETVNPPPGVEQLRNHLAGAKPTWTASLGYRSPMKETGGDAMKQDASGPSPVRLTGNRARVRRYRTCHRRIDYVPSPDVLRIIDHHFKKGIEPCMVGVIDYLIRTAHRTITGNGGT
jgi:hypothetical protein